MHLFGPSLLVEKHAGGGGERERTYLCTISDEVGRASCVDVWTAYVEPTTTENNAAIPSARPRRRPMSAPLGQGYIPNSLCRPLGPSQQKMFCGRFSTTGDVLLTASQDAEIKLYDSESVYQWSAKPASKQES